jgi:hypothetical protein
MNGTWQGAYSGTNTGQIVVEIDDMGDHFQGCVYVYDNNAALPRTFAVLNTADKSNKFKLKPQLAPLDPRTGEPTTWQAIASLYPAGIAFPTSADVECEWDDRRLKISWVTDIGTLGSADIAKSKADQPSTCTLLPISTWEYFKKYVTGIEQFRFIYRGQTNTWRLRSPFHRTGRGDTRKFFSEDIPALHRSLRYYACLQLS